MIKVSIQNLSKNASNLISILSKHLILKKPDVLIILGDRFETFIALVAGVISKVKIAHIHGGELTLALEMIYIDTQLQKCQIFILSHQPYIKKD